MPVLVRHMLLHILPSQWTVIQPAKKCEWTMMQQTLHSISVNLVYFPVHQFIIYSMNNSMASKSNILYPTTIHTSCIALITLPDSWCLQLSCTNKLCSSLTKPKTVKQKKLEIDGNWQAGQWMLLPCYAYSGGFTGGWGDSHPRCPWASHEEGEKMKRLTTL